MNLRWVALALGIAVVAAIGWLALRILVAWVTLD
jgi:hypothetical protein